MWDAVEQGIEAAFDVAGRPATYRRGETSKSITVLPGRQGQHTAGHVAPTQISDGEFIIRLSDLEELNLPLDGDELMVDFGGRDKSYALRSREDQTASWDYVPGNRYARIHTTLQTDAPS